MNKKLLLITIGASILMLIIGTLLFNQNKKSPEETTTQLSQQQINSLEKPSIPSLVGSPNQFSISVNTSALNFPESVPLLFRASHTEITQSRAEEIANSLNFNSSPIITSDVELGETLIWTDDDKGLVFYLSQGRLDYTRNSIPENVEQKNISTEELKSIAGNFLTNQIGLNRNSISFSSFSFKKIFGNESAYDTNKAEAQIITVNIVPSTSKFPIITLDPDKSPILVKILPDGSVFSSNVSLITNFTESEAQAEILKPSEIQNHLSDALVVRIDEGNVSPTNLGLSGKKITNINITGITLNYLMDKDQATILQPIFFLEGKGFVEGIDGEVEIGLYLPALKSFYEPTPTP